VSDQGAGYQVSLFGGPRFEGPAGTFTLSPYQAALLALVYAEEGISRPRISRILWRRDLDSRTRARIRQLCHQIQRKAGGVILRSDGDALEPLDTVRSDVRDFRAEIEASELLLAAQRLAMGFLPDTLPGVEVEFDDWRQRFEHRMRKGLVASARTAWEFSAGQGEWGPARDAAEALYLLSPRSAEACEHTIEARARLGKLRAAEVAYAEYRTLHGAAAVPASLDQLMERVRQIDHEEDNSCDIAHVPFLGRARAITELSSVFGDVKAGKFSFAVISGEAGIGKTRLMAELQRSATLDGVRCLSAHPVELERRISLNPILDALRAVDLHAHLTALGEPWKSVVGSMLPHGALSIPLDALPPIEEQGLSRRLLDAFALLLNSLAEECPTLLFIDDLQWADATTISLLRFYQRRWPESRFGVVSTLRPEAISERNPVATYLSDSDHVTHRLPLGELEEDEGLQLIELLGKGRISADASAKLIRLAGFHPLYLTELARDLLAERLVLPDSDSPDVQIPISVRHILIARTKGLSDSATAIAQILSAIAKPMHLASLGELAHLTLDATADAVEELRRSRIVELNRDTAWVAHGLFRSALYAGLSEPRRVLVHRQIADMLLEGSGEDDAGELATHLEKAGDAGMASTQGWLAGDRALQQGAVAEAAYFFELVTRNEQDHVKRATATARFGCALFLGRDMARAIPALELASGRLRGVGADREARRVDIRRIEGLAGTGLEALGDLLERLATVREEAREADDWEAVALALDVELQLLDGSTDLAGIRRVFADMKSVASRGGPEAGTVCHLGLAMSVLWGDPVAGMKSARLAVRLSEQALEHRPMALLRLMVVLQLRALALTPESEAVIAEARELAAHRGDLRLSFLIESNLAVGLLDSGELDRAEVQLEKSATMLGAANMGRDRFNHANNRAELGLARSDYEDAERWFREANREVGASTPEYAEDIINAGLGLCALESGALGVARQCEEAGVVLPTLLTFDPSTIVTFKVRLLERRDQIAEAIDLLDTVSDRLRGRLDLAWLKLGIFRLGKLAKWGHGRSAEALAPMYISFARASHLSRREAEFRYLTERILR
jgi:DNA-binding SARP family transcriptional activator/tetratricopeptide (TPR) repeat protein